MMRRLVFVLSVLAFAACKGDTGDTGATGPTGPDGPPGPPGLPAVGSVAVTPPSGTLSTLGETVQLTASAKDVRGNAISGVIFDWSSSDPVVATISSTGLATAVGTGPATISATAGGFSASSLLTVVLTTHETVATGVDGMVQFADANLDVEVVDVVTGEPIGGIEVTLVEDSGVMGLLIFDPDGGFAPVIRMTDQTSVSAAGSRIGALTIHISLLVRLIPRSFQDAVAGFAVKFDRRLIEYLRDTWLFECHETTLGNAFTAFDALRTGVYGALESHVVFAVLGTILAGIVSGGTVPAIASVATAGSLTAITFNLELVDSYRARGYNDSDRFEVCQLDNDLIGTFFDGLIFLAPLEDLPPPTGTASLSGTVRNALTSVAVPGEVQVVGPAPLRPATQDAQNTV